MALLQETISSMESLAKSSEWEIVAKQSVEVLEALLKVSEPSAASSGNLRLKIPCFGTSNISRTPIIQNENTTGSVFPSQNIHANNTAVTPQDGQGVPNQFVNTEDLYDIPISPSPPSTPLVSFISSKFPALGTEMPMGNWERQWVRTSLPLKPGESGEDDFHGCC